MTKYIIGLMFILAINSCATNDAVCDEETAPATYLVSMQNPINDAHYGFGDTIDIVGNWIR